MARDLKLYLFGDQTYDIQPHLRDLLRFRNNPVLEDFLVSSYNVVREEIYKLPPKLRNELPRFTCIDDLMTWDQAGHDCIPLAMAMTCIYQLGFFIVYTKHENHDPIQSRVLGFCTGALAAAAVSCSRNTQELVSMAVDAVLVAFRSGVRVAHETERFANPQTRGQSWSIIVSKTTSLDVVQRFCDQTNLPPTGRPYVSAHSPNGITISGPPASLAELVNSNVFKPATYRSIAIRGPYHAPHLYSQRDVDDIVSGLASTASTSRSERVPLFSSTGSHATDRHFAALLEAAVRQILLEPIHWDDSIDQIQTFLQSSAADSFSVIPFGTTADSIIYNVLKQTPSCALLPSPPKRVEIEALCSPNSENVDPKRPKLAIIGMSGRFPGAKDNEAFWDLLHQGLDVHKPVPALHWSAATHVDTTGSRKNTSATPYGCWLDDPAAFDARFFNISPREAPQIDPAQRLALMTAYEAIEQAGLVPDATPSTRPDRMGIFYGVTSNDWMETNSAQNIDTYFIPGGNRAFIPGRINYCFKFSGPSYAIDTACSSSLAGIHLACNSLWRGDIDTAIAGGTNILTNPDFTAGLDRGHFLSRTGNCKTFDDGADGYCRGEGVGTVIIKRLDDALAEKDPILGVILGAYTNHSAESESITRPHVGAQRAIFNKILNQDAVDPFSVSYVEMHGTGTQAGDAGEMSSVLDVFAPPASTSHGKRSRSKDEALFLGSAKSNIGHGEAASGVSSLIKVLLMMQKNIIPPHCGIKDKINRKFPTDLEERNVHIALKPTPWEKNADLSKPRRVFVNNFSAAGGNSALLLEDAPRNQEPSHAYIDERDLHLLACSAKNGTSLQGNLRSLLGFLKRNMDVPLGQLSYTTTSRRMHHPHRVMLTGSTTEAICSQIEAALNQNVGMTRSKSAPHVIFTFTGQGAQYPGMGRQLFKHFSLFRREILQLDQMARNMGFPSFLPVIQSEGQDIGVYSPTEAQLAGVCVQIALSKLWMSWNVTPAAVVGHSLGEYVALNVAGVLSDTDTIYLVGKRAELLQEKCTRDTHAMLVIRGSIDDIATILKDKKYETACINSPVETVLAGSNEEIAGLKQLLAEAGLKATLLKVPYAFHSSQIDPIISDFRTASRGVTFSEARIPILCSLNGNVVEESGCFGPDYLASHSRQPVNMWQALLTARSKRLVTDQTVFLEIGPHPAITGMVKATLGPQVAGLVSLQRGRSSWHTIGASLKHLYDAGADIRWEGYQHDFVSSHKVVSLPAYSWDLKEYWIQYIHDWSLRKGDAPLTISAPKLESTTIHRVVEETSDSQKTRIVVEADIARKDLSPLVQGHEVDGIPLCTPSVYTDIALSLGAYALQRYRPHQEEHVIDVSKMEIFKALILRADASKQLLQAHAEVDWSSQSATIKFLSFDSKQTLQEHSRCVLRFLEKSLQSELQGQATSITQKIRNLRDGISTGVTARFNRPMVYRAIRPLARFHADYRAIDEVVLNSDTLEASSRLSFGGVKKDGDFHTHPAIIDALTQSCGFAVNCNDKNDLDQDVFMNHGWGSFQMFEPIDYDKVYTTYTQMKEGPDRLWRGDVVVFDGDRVVAYFGQVAMQGVPRRVLGVILSIESGRKSQKSQPTMRRQPGLEASIIAPVTQQARPSANSTANTISRALSIIAEESSLSVTDLTDDTVFSDAGIDSLLGLTISARFKEELDIDVDFNAFFFDFPTISKLKVFLSGSSSENVEVSTAQSTDLDGSASPSTILTGITTPDSRQCSTPKVDFELALKIISEESGISMNDFSDDTCFADVGIDSLLSLVIVSRLRDELELEIQHESFLLECPTVADFKHLLLGSSSQNVVLGSSTDDNHAKEAPALKMPGQLGAAQPRSETEMAELAARKKAVDECVRKYIHGFHVPSPSSSSPIHGDDGKVVLVTGATGSLGSNLVFHLAQLPDIKTVVCLNRENKAEPNVRQLKAMREKGIRFPEDLKPKLLVLQTDSSKPKLGLSEGEYERLATSVTHLIHSAWPMSAKRTFDGFESQFQIMRNLINLACDAASRRPESFKFSFQMVSSIAVIGHHGLRNGEKRTVVPEERVDIDSVLPNGYGDAKWGCERMLDETLHKHPQRFRVMAVRLGQIAGSKTSGYWNPMEHFGFVIKSSQTLNALPDVDGTVSWTPVNDIAGALSDLILSSRRPYPIYHIDNPIGQPWREVNAILADALKIPNLIPFKDWLERVRAAPQKNNPASTLLEFLDSNYPRMSCGGLVLDVRKTLEHSKALSGVGPVSEEVVRKYIHIWKEIGFLS